MLGAPRPNRSLRFVGLRSVLMQIKVRAYRLFRADGSLTIFFADLGKQSRGPLVQFFWQARITGHSLKANAFVFEVVSLARGGQRFEVGEIFFWLVHG